MAVEYLTSANDDGTNFGKSATSKIGFYGLTTPIVQPSISLSAADIEAWLPKCKKYICGHDYQFLTVKKSGN